ncbi:ubinuclein-1 isoform X3 [Lethenteron reissneri]|uniref:ubinuclein-1 isoform X3 n=1 Tax=Lethenteron reissneri TaxID=7753 RepID=UPI002AB73787|nr:ubinuclein-1 isoform X3 [Lethenteron reissneri]
MAEPRRATLSTVSGPFVADKKAEGDAGAKAAKATTAQRFVLTLGESTDEACPEFYYPELLLRAAAGKTPKKNNDDPFNEEERERKEVEALAKKFEEKYSTSKQKLRRDRVQDLVDIGYGYDETDSFIDNSEAYDELVPASLTTKYGGFYINTGTLQFRPASDSEDDNASSNLDKHKKPLKEGEDKMMKKRKRKEGPEKEKMPKKLKVLKQIGITPLNSDKSEKQKKKKSKGSISLPEMIERFQKEKEEAAMKQEKVAQASPASGNSVNATNASAPEELVKAPVSKPEPLPMPDCSADQLLPNLFGPGCDLDLLQVVANAAHNLTSLDLDSLLEDSPNSSLSQESEAPCQQAQLSPKLPDGLPAPLDMKIKQLAEVAKTCDSEGKQKLFSQDVSHILLDIEVQTKELNSQLRGGVYAHVASLLGCSKESLLRRAKKLHQHEQDGRLKSPMHKLRDAVGAVMPEQTVKYQETYQAHTQAKYAKVDIKGIMSEEREREDKDKNASDDDDDDEKPGKRVFGPRKKFQWNTEIRDLLCNVVKVKMAGYDAERIKSQSAEDYLKAFLEAEVKPLWPKGWMQSRMLFKESRAVHGHITAAPIQYTAFKKETSTSCSLQEKKRQEVCCKTKIESANVKDAAKESTKKKFIPPAKPKLKQDTGLKPERKPLIATTGLVSVRPGTPNVLPANAPLTASPVPTNTMANQPAQPKPMVPQAAAVVALGQSALAQPAAIHSRPSSSSPSSGPSGVVQTTVGTRTVIASPSSSSPNSSVLVSALPMQSRGQHVAPPVYNIDNSLDDELILNPGVLGSVTETLAALNNAALIDKLCLPGLLLGSSDSIPKSVTRQPTSGLEKKPVQQNPPPSATARSSPVPAGHYPLSLLADQAANRKQLPQQGKSASGHPQVVIQAHRNVISGVTQLQKQKAAGATVVSHAHQKPALQQSSHRQYQQNSNPSAKVANQQYVIKTSVASHSKDSSQKQHQPHIQQPHIQQHHNIKVSDRLPYKQSDIIKIPIQSHSLPQASTFPSNSLGNNTMGNIIAGVIGHSGVSANSASSGQKFKMPYSPSTKAASTGAMASSHPSNSPVLGCSPKRLAAGAPKLGPNSGSPGSAGAAHGLASTGKVAAASSHKSPSHPPPPSSSPASSTSPNQIVSGSSLLATGTAAALLPTTSVLLGPKATASSAHKPTSALSHKPPQPAGAVAAAAAQPARPALHAPIRNILIPVNFTDFDSDAAMSGRDAIITGPAPGTFHHGLPHSESSRRELADSGEMVATWTSGGTFAARCRGLYTGLHSSPQPQGPQPHSALPARFPQSFPDASSLQKDASNLPRKTQ